MLSKLSELRLSPWFGRTALLFVVVAVDVVLWANRYGYVQMTFPTGHTLPVRIHRLTGHTEALYPGGWESLGPSEGQVSESWFSEMVSLAGFLFDVAFNGSYLPSVALVSLVFVGVSIAFMVLRELSTPISDLIKKNRTGLFLVLYSVLLFLFMALAFRWPA